MRFPHTKLFLFLSVFLLSQTKSALAIPNDARATQIIGATLGAAGGALAIHSVRDFRASGVIQYNWGLSPLQGTATITSIGTTDCRFDMSVPGQDRSWYVKYGQGKVRENGKVLRLPSHAGANRTTFGFPAIKLAAAADDPAFRVSYVGIEKDAGRELYHLRSEKVSRSDKDYDKWIARFESVDYFIDPETMLIVKTEDVAHPLENADVNQRHILEFSDFRNMNGIQVPFSIVEHIDNAETWSLQLSDVNLNQGLTRSDIEF